MRVWIFWPAGSLHPSVPPADQLNQGTSNFIRMTWQVKGLMVRKVVQVAPGDKREENVHCPATPDISEKPSVRRLKAFGVLQVVIFGKGVFYNLNIQITGCKKQSEERAALFQS